MLGDRWQEVRRVAVADLGTDFDPTSGALCDATEIDSVGDAGRLGAILVAGVYVTAGGVHVPGGSWAFRPVVPARVTDLIPAAPGNDSDAVPLFGAEVTGLAGGEIYVIDGMSAGGITFAVTAGTAPGGAESHLVIYARKA